MSLLHFHVFIFLFSEYYFLLLGAVNGGVELVATASKDRTVRFWKVIRMPLLLILNEVSLPYKVLVS